MVGTSVVVVDVELVIVDGVALQQDSGQNSAISSGLSSHWLDFDQVTQSSSVHSSSDAVTIYRYLFVICSLDSGHVGWT